MNKVSLILRISIFLLCLFTGSSVIKAQVVITQQTIDRTSGNLPQEQLDKGVYRCFYRFQQQVTERETGEITIQTDTMALDFGRYFSVYYDWNKSRRDSVQHGMVNELDIKTISQKTNSNFDMTEYRDTEGTYFVISPKGENARVYKNRLKNEIISVDITNLESIKCVEQLPPQEWQFSGDTLTILGYVCQRAAVFFRGREYQVWFTAGIPIKEGPWKLYGLPGLILKAVADDGLFVFEAIGLENLNDVYITMSKDMYLNCTRQQFAKYKSDKRKKLLARHYFNGSLTVGSTRNPFDYNELETE